MKFINRTKTTTSTEALIGGMRPMGPGALRFVDDVTNADGSHTVAPAGNIPLGSRPVLCTTAFPSRFDLRRCSWPNVPAKGVSAKADLAAKPDYHALSMFYRPENRVASFRFPVAV